MTYEAAIIHGPRGPFGILRVSSEDGEQSWSDRQRAALRRCFQDKHGNLPVVFLSTVGGQFELHSDEPVDGIEDCIRQAGTPNWQPLEEQ